MAWKFGLSAAFTAVLLATTSIAHAAEGPVKIGVLTDMSSLYSDSGGKGSQLAAEMAVEDFGGSALGQKIQVIGADHQNKADIGANIARDWYDNGGVDVISDVPNSAVALAVQQITRDKNKIFLISAGGSSDLTGSACSPNSIHWTYDTYALAHGTGGAMVKQGGDSWFFITADYAFGHALERDTTAEVVRQGGKVLGSVNAPLGTADFSSFLLQAQASKAKVIGLANAGGDTKTSVKQAHEFGIVSGGQKLAGMLVNIDDVHALGLETAQGLIFTEGFYWDLNDETRAFAKRFFAKDGLMPSSYQAGVYSSVMHYLKAVKAVGSKDTQKVLAWMHANKVDDFFSHGGYIREDGRMVHDMYLLQAKTPAESKGEWDLYKVLKTMPGEEVYRPLKDGGCPLVKG
ncbi:MAG TPA: ABC transporter substrate-binding protein [Aliidongia sp.]|uniref:ABC transporter substrate-binding protein n=1 Tax=Aliidongia sp. TaxID=1914230 RepID=UPI002DDC9850|nr:ABC transporter substrate-binding protein [Aliidongia sp.]HEV2677195.1 ABC transporter substrate-binding protein [Aliidongia sp.]